MNKKKIALFAIILIVIGVAFYFKDELNIMALKQTINEAGIYAPIIFMLLYILSTVLILPVSLLTLAAGALFGPYLGTFYSLLAATIGATIALLISRYLAGDMVKKYSKGKVKTIIDGVNEEGWQFVAFIRLVPLFPFNIVNYIFGLTSIRLLPYFLTSFIFMLPGGFAYCYLGYVGGHAASGETKGLITKIIIGLSLLAVVIFIPKLILKYRKKKTT